jgi:hypothetical protein
VAAIFSLGGVCGFPAQASLLDRTLGEGLGLTVVADEHELSRISMLAIQAMKKRWRAMLKLGRTHSTNSCPGEAGFPAALGFGR